MNTTRDSTIQLASQKDAESISMVLYQSFLEYKPSYTPEAFLVTTLDKTHILQRMQEGPIWIALLNQSVVGTVSVVEKNEGLRIRGMAIIPEARGNQIGWKLLVKVEGFAVKKGIKKLFLSTTPFLKRAVRLYENFGFSVSPEGPHELLGTPLFTMVKYIGM